MRLNKFLSNSGVASRRKSDDLISQGKVRVNGKTVTEFGTIINEKKDKVEVEGKAVCLPSSFVYIKLNKPKGYACTANDEKGRKTIYELVKCEERLFSVGRLDYDTEGLIILTNDGDFANILMHPTNEIDKVYLAKLEGIIKGEQINKLKSGVLLDDILVKATRVKLKKVIKESNSCLVEITIHEGKNHQVKRMFESVGFHVEKLTRKRIGIFDCKNLKSGEYRKLTPKEVQIVYSYKK